MCLCLLLSLSIANLHFFICLKIDFKYVISRCKDDLVVVVVVVIAAVVVVIHDFKSGFL